MPFGEVIYQYTRAQAIADGVLVDVSDMASEAGIKYPTVVTERVWHELIVPSEKGRAEGQSEAGRLWDTLWMLHNAVKRSPGGRSDITFKVIYRLPGEKTPNRLYARTITLMALCHPGDNCEPVITIMFPEED